MKTFVDMISFCIAVMLAVVLGGEWANCIVLAYVVIAIAAKARTGGLWVLIGIALFVLLPVICGALGLVVSYVQGVILAPMEFVRGVKPLYFIVVLCGVGFVLCEVKRKVLRDERD